MLDKTKFRFKSQLTVRNYEIDWQRIVHNANTLLYFELGRVAYLEHVGVKVDVNSVQHEAKVVVVRNEIDYRPPGSGTSWTCMRGYRLSGTPVSPSRASWCTP